MKLSKKNKLIGIVLLVIVAIVGITGYQSYQHPQLELKEPTIKAEYGQDVKALLDDNIDASFYDDDVSDLIDYSSEDLNDFDDVDVGEYQITYHYRGSDKTIKLIVEDTTAPVIELKNSASVFENEQIKYDDLVEVEELSKYKTTIDDSLVNYNTPGNYIAKYIVEDKYGNQAVKEIPVTINELLLQTSSPASISLNPSGTSKFEVTTNCHDAIAYTSSNPDVATVDSSGNIVAKSAGSTTITACVKGKNVCTNVIVSNPQPVNNYNTTHHNNNHHSETHHNTTNDNVSYTVYKTKTGDCYHRSGCRYLSRSCIPVSKSGAISQGLRACSVCNP